MVEGSQGKKGGLLNVWLIVLLIGLVIGLIVYLFAGLSLQQTNPEVSVLILWILAAITILNIISVGAIFKRKRLGIYSFAVLSIAAFGISYYQFGFTLNISLYLVGLVVLVLLAVPKWNSFE